MLCNAGAVDRAYALLRPIGEETALDEVTRAILAHNLGLSLSDLGRHAEAIAHLHRAAAQYDVLGLSVERTRTRYVLGRALLAAGKPFEAIPVLQSAAREFASHGMILDAGLVRLEQAEALLSVNQAAGVPALCGAVRDARASLRKLAVGQRRLFVETSKE